MTPYRHLAGYLHRWKVFEYGKFMLRVHHILDIDRTPFLHTHPFYYVSIILRGGYVEQVLRPSGEIILKRHRPGSVIIRKPQTYHRISELYSHKCVTLFFSYKATKWWNLQRHPEVTSEGYNDYPDDLYIINGKHQKRFDGKWYIPNEDIDKAQNEFRLSIHQNIQLDD